MYPTLHLKYLSPWKNETQTTALSEPLSEYMGGPSYYAWLKHTLAGLLLTHWEVYKPHNFILFNEPGRAHCPEGFCSLKM